MKKALIIITALFYLTITSGVVVNIHYCMGELAEVNYGHEDDQDCAKCGMKDKEGCCHTDHKLVKADEGHIKAPSTAESFDWIGEIPFFYLTEIVMLYDRQQPALSAYDSPPDKRNNSLCLYNGVFRV